MTIFNPPNLSGYVPYTGAISDVDLGTHTLTTTGLGTFGKLNSDGGAITTDGNGILQLWNTATPTDAWTFDPNMGISGNALKLTYTNFPNASIFNFDPFYGLQIYTYNGTSGTTLTVSGGKTTLDNGDISTDGIGNLTALSFIKSGGTSSQFLKADGSLDSSTYLTSLSGALLADGSVTGATSQNQFFTNGVSAGTGVVRPTIIVSGVMSPDWSGTYNYAGQYNQNDYYSDGAGHYI